VESLPLIASSIMSKKLASGANAIVLDVKYGNGAFMKTKKDAKKLANLMVKIGNNFNKKVDYVLSDMNEPLGYNVGNKLEAYEAIELLSGKLG
jgi:thymidine phosphorylase